MNCIWVSVVYITVENVYNVTKFESSKASVIGHNMRCFSPLLSIKIESSNTTF